jgi:hypothetical protein
MSLASWPTLCRGSMFDRDGERMAQADQFEQLDVASVFILLESGHSNRTTVEHAKYVPSRFPDRYLVHVTNEKNLSSIRRLGLLPGGTRGGRQDVHFALNCSLTTMQNSLRPESDCIIVGFPSCVEDLDSGFTESQYVLAKKPVPFSRFLGVWSLVDCCWGQRPNDSDLVL